jgi:hypothetical protein
MKGSAPGMMMCRKICHLLAPRQAAARGSYWFEMAMQCKKTGSQITLLSNKKRAVENKGLTGLLLVCNDLPLGRSPR